MSNEINNSDSYRDKISTVDKEGKRAWIYPEKPKGPLYTARTWVSIGLLIFLFLGPFIKVNNQPLLLFDILNRRFIIFGLGFWPQDFHIFVLATIALIIFIILFTVIYGRVFCGWICPQTIFMEMLFRKIEYWLEGDAVDQKRLNKKSLNAKKFIIKLSKHIIFYAISFIIGNIFLAYIIGSRELVRIITDPPGEHLAGLTAMILFSAAFYFVFAFFREQVCTLVCPYGRLQGVLLDQKSIVVAYDFKRGEPRGKINTAGRGDCINCKKCVHVCPTGIDIRNGTQLECINCTACIDACNAIMQTVDQPKGLIRYASFNGITQGEKLSLNPRILGYSGVLLLIIILTATLLLTRAPIETTILRTPGVLFQELEDGRIANLFNVKIINKTFESKKIQLDLKSPQGEIDIIGTDLVVPEGSLVESSFFVKIHSNILKFTSTPLLINVSANGEVLEEIRTSFIGPNPIK
jgi:cytochrome c oxidase accessory protein FixG